MEMQVSQSADGEGSSGQAGGVMGPAKLVRETQKSEKKDRAGGLPLGKSSMIIPIIEARQNFGGRLETH